MGDAIEREIACLEEEAKREQRAANAARDRSDAPNLFRRFERLKEINEEIAAARSKPGV